jgi:hypothetical protein
MPSRAARRLANVLFPVPLVPHSSTATLLRRSRILSARCNQSSHGSIVGGNGAQIKPDCFELDASKPS